MGVIRDAAAPYLLWIKLALAAVMLGGAAYAGNAARAHWDAGDIATAQAATQAAITSRGQWRTVAETWQDAINKQKAATAKAKADAARDAELASKAIDQATASKREYDRRRQQIEADAVADAGAPCASVKVSGSPLE